MEQYFKNFLEAISPALTTLLITLVTVILGQVTAYLSKQYGLAKAKLTAEQQAIVDFVAYRTVQTVEQIYKNSSNKFKRDEAISMAEKTLNGYGLEIDLDLIANAIEAQVFSQKPAIVEEPKG